MVSNTPERELHVLIIGAGISGLLLAQGLKKHGIRVSLFEAEDSPNVDRLREWGMSIQCALPLLSSLLPDEIVKRLQSASVDPHFSFPDSGNSMPVFNAANGELIANVPLVKMLRVSRRKMRTLCAEGMNVQYAMAFKSFDHRSQDGQVSATFTDRTTASGNLIIGADGANSVFRNAIFSGNEVSCSQQAPYGGANLHVCYKDATIAKHVRSMLSPIMAIGVHPAGYWLWLSVQDVPDPERPQDWTFQLQWTFRIDDTVEWGLRSLDLQKMKEIADRSFDEPFKTAWTKIPPGTKMPSMNRVSVWNPVPVPNDAYDGTVALAGDAAHAMPFHRGQGLNHGIADAVKLTELLVAVKLGEKSQKDALSEYENEMIRRAGEEILVSRMNTEMMHDWEKFKKSPFMQRGGDWNK